MVIIIYISQLEKFYNKIKEIVSKAYDTDSHSKTYTELLDRFLRKQKKMTWKWHNHRLQGNKR